MKEAIPETTCRPFVSVMLFMAICFVACNHELEFSSDSRYRLSFSTDTVSFDTVFTTVGSSTILMNIYNPNDMALIFDARVGDMSSPFQVNIDGQSGNSFNGLEIESHDSVLVFINVTACPTGTGDPVVFLDSLVVTLESGVRQIVVLKAYGQDVEILRKKTISSDTVFTAYRPFLIYDTLMVDSGVTLFLSPGVKMYYHKGAALVVDGRIVAAGKTDSMITMRGDRLDNLLDDIPYSLLPGQWGGILLSSASYDNEFTSCNIQGADNGIVAYSSDMERVKMTVKRSVLHNMSGYCLYLKNTCCSVSNSQITNGRAGCVALVGGNNTFNFCTIAGFYPFGISGCSMLVTNTENGELYPVRTAVFKNCIITGKHNEEIADYMIDSISGNQDSTSALSISYSLVRATDTVGRRYMNVVLDSENAQNNFRHVALGNYRYDFRLDSLSAAIGVADSLDKRFYPEDLLGASRLSYDDTDAGCYIYKR